jgi:hypothetical protein
MAIHCDITSYILLTVVLGYGLSAMNLWRTPDKWLRSSIAILPISTQDLIGARFRAEWGRIIVSIISSSIFVLAALLIPAEYHDNVKPFGYLLWSLMPVSQKLIMAAYFVVTIASISLNRIVSTLICFRLQRDIKKIIVIIFTTVGILGAYLFVLLLEYSLPSSPQGQTLFHKHFYTFLTNGWPYMLGFVVTVKLILTVWAVFLLKQSNALSRQIKAIGAIIWLIVYTSYIVFAWYKIPHVSFWYIAGLMYLFMPTVRLCIAPVNIDWNRHR